MRRMVGRRDEAVGERGAGAGAGWEGLGTGAERWRWMRMMKRGVAKLMGRFCARRMNGSVVRVERPCWRAGGR